MRRVRTVRFLCFTAAPKRPNGFTDASRRAVFSESYSSVSQLNILHVAADWASCKFCRSEGQIRRTPRGKMVWGSVGVSFWLRSDWRYHFSRRLLASKKTKQALSCTHKIHIMSPLKACSLFFLSAPQDISQPQQLFKCLCSLKQH